MSNGISLGDKLLVGFLRFMVFVLVVILVAIPICILLDLVGIL